MRCGTIRCDAMRGENGDTDEMVIVYEVRGGAVRSAVRVTHTQHIITPGSSTNRGSPACGWIGGGVSSPSTGPTLVPSPFPSSDPESMSMSKRNP